MKSKALNMNLDRLKEHEANCLIERMRTVRSAGYSHAGEIQEEAKRLVDWKEYVLAKPLTSVTATFLTGFVIVRGLTRIARESSSLTLNSKPNFLTSGSLGSTIARSAMTLATTVASSAVRNYISKFTHDITYGRESNDRSNELQSQDKNVN